LRWCALALGSVKQALRESVERRRSGPELKARLRRIIDED